MIDGDDAGRRTRMRQANLNNGDNRASSSRDKRHLDDPTSGFCRRRRGRLLDREAEASYAEGGGVECSAQADCARLSAALALTCAPGACNPSAVAMFRQESGVNVSTSFPSFSSCCAPAPCASDADCAGGAICEDRFDLDGDGGASMRACVRAAECATDMDCEAEDRCRRVALPTSGRTVARCRRHRRTCSSHADCGPCSACLQDPDYGARTCRTRDPQEQAVLDSAGLFSPCQDDEECYEGQSCVDRKCQEVDCLVDADCAYAEEKCVTTQGEVGRKCVSVGITCVSDADCSPVEKAFDLKSGSIKCLQTKSYGHRCLASHRQQPHVYWFEPEHKAQHHSAPKANKASQLPQQLQRRLLLKQQQQLHPQVKQDRPAADPRSKSQLQQLLQRQKQLLIDKLLNDSPVEQQ